MSTPFDSSLLSGYLDGELDADEIALVERVLDEQPERLRELETLRHLHNSLATLPAPQPTVDPVVAVRARIEKTRPAPLGSPRHWWLQVTPFALAACLLLAAGWIMFGSDRKPSQLASDQMASDQLASPANETTAERAESFERARAFSNGESSRLGRSADQPASALLTPEASFEQLGAELPAEPQRPSQDAEPQQEAIAPAASALRSSGPRSRAVTPERPNGVSEGLEEFGGMAASTSEADDAAPARSLSALPESADVELFYSMPENRSPTNALARGAASPEPRQPNVQNAVRLRYEVPEDERADTVRWLRTVVPRELKELPPAGDVKRYWFYGHQQEQQALQAAIKKRLEVTEGQLNVVQSADRESQADPPDQDAASIGRAKAIESSALAERKTSAGDAVTSPSERASDRDRSARAMARPGDSPPASRLSDADARPTAIIVELVARPKE